LINADMVERQAIAKRRNAKPLKALSVLEDATRPG
jgi:hypothetical protein